MLLNNVEMEDEDEELVAIIRPDATPNHGNLELQSVSARSPGMVTTAWAQKSQSEASEGKPESFFLEPLMPAVLRPAKEKQVINKEDECGEGKTRGFVAKRLSEGHASLAHKKASSNHADHNLNRTFSVTSSSDVTVVAGASTAEPTVHPEVRAEPFRPLASSSLEPSSREQQPFGGFFLHANDEGLTSSMNVGYAKSPSSQAMETSWTMVRQDSDSDVLDLEDAEQDLLVDDHPIIAKYIGEEESAKLQEDMKVKEHEDKDDASGRSSPCLSTISQVSSVSMTSGSARMTSFAERKLQRLNSYETKSSTSSSQKTTPDGSECCPAPLTTWKQKREQSPNRQSKDNVNVLASELVQLHMQLEEKRRAIETQKKKMEALSARQRLKLGKAAFLHVVKKGKSPDASQPLRPEHFVKEYVRHNGEGLDDAALKSEAFLTKEEGGQDVLDDTHEAPPVKIQETVAFVEQPKEPTLHDIEKSKMISAALLEENVEATDINECDLSIEKLNETISTLQQAILKISQQQELLMKAPAMPSMRGGGSQDQKIKAPVHFVEPLSPTGTSSLRKPRLGQGRASRSGRPSELKVSKDRQQAPTRIKTPTPSVDTLPHLRQFPANHSPKTLTEKPLDNSLGPGSAPPEKLYFDGHRLGGESNQQGAFVLSTVKDTNILSEALKDVNSNVEGFSSASLDSLGKENLSTEEPLRGKTSLIEVDLSDLKASYEEGEVESQGSSTDLISDIDQKSGVGFFFKVRAK